MEQLTREEAHLCLLPAHQSDRWAALLSDDEEERRKRFRFERHRQQFAMAHGFLRETLSHYTGVDPRDWTFSRNEWGRPEIDEPREHRALRFNLSHTRGMVAVLVAWQRDVGVDVEAIDESHDGMKVAERFFSPSEAAALRQLPVERQTDRFFEYWTLKEAYIKARGMGLALPLDQFSFVLPAPVTIRFDERMRDDADAWQFGQHRVGASHLVAYAIRREERRDLKVRIVTRMG